MSQIFTLEEAANHFKIKPRLLRQKVNEGWPCLRINKINIRFTEEHIRQIEAGELLNQLSPENQFGRITK